MEKIETSSHFQREQKIIFKFPNRTTNVKFRRPCGLFHESGNYREKENDNFGLEPSRFCTDALSFFEEGRGREDEGQPNVATEKARFSSPQNPPHVPIRTSQDTTKRLVNVLLFFFLCVRFFFLNQTHGYLKRMGKRSWTPCSLPSASHARQAVAILRQ